MFEANNPALSSWISVDAESDFPIQNIPFGIFSHPKFGPRVCTIIGDTLIDLKAIADHQFLNGMEFDKEVLAKPALNDLIALGKSVTSALRLRISELFRSDNPEIRDNAGVKANSLHEASACQMLLPIQVGDYTDFYSSKEHATNVGTMFRDPNNALLPNWLHIPIGYHGRASSIIVSGTPIKRPCGQTIPADSTQPVYGPCRLLDFELEMGFVVGKGTELGDTINIADAEDHIFGLCLFNDWSARDIQKWEYVPLGPFLGKSFASTVSPWIITLDALEPFRVQGPKQDPEVLPYLQLNGARNFDIHLEVDIVPETGKGLTVCKSNFKHMYWNMPQQLTHHAINGCNMRVGDFYASGTISGPTADSYGSMLEISWRGTKPVQMPDGSERKFIADGDTVVMRGFAKKDGIKVGFGEVKNLILPATPQ